MNRLPLLNVEGVSKAFPNGALALDGISCALGEGEFVSLLGPSGCGKSTLLRLVAGLSAPTSGNIAWGDGLPGRSSQRPAAEAGKLPVAFVFQEPTLLPWASVAHNVALPLRLEGAAREDVRRTTADALALVGLTDFAAAYPRELSGGMQMRASVARALVTRPRLLLLDEPFAALDEITRNRLNDDLLSAWQQRGWAALFVTHSVFEAVYLASRVLVMSARPGRIVADIGVDLPYPRERALRTSAAYVAICKQASEALQRAMQSAGSAPPEEVAAP
jgi:NitT/TauT family transport system ATP-binding protein